VGWISFINVTDSGRYSSDEVTTSGGARMSRQPGHFQVSKVVRQVTSCEEGPKGLRTRPVSPEGSGTTSSRPNYCTYAVNSLRKF